MRILLPLDFSENSKKTFDFAIILAKKKNATITILHVIEAIYDFAAQAAIVIDGMHRDAEKYIQGLIEDTKKRSPDGLSHQRGNGFYHDCQNSRRNQCRFNRLRNAWSKWD
ncbi:universal stress protein [Algoriphagus halophilus]|uniref:universal stress protein n=1 Tax=Algoriphagus halophilus TaxID=226505 RepID=UPI00358FCD11